MQYMGGKSRISKAISKVMLEHTPKRGDYIEPFVGGGAVAEKMAPHFETVVLNDLHEDLMLMWDAVLNKGWVPPTEVSYEQYQELRNAEPSALRGFVGFGCSFGGKWFGGYARYKDRNYALTCHNVVMRQAKAIGNAICLQGSYADLPSVDDSTVIYCDPPYAGTTEYKNKNFPHEQFWDKAREWSESGATVFVSEYNAPKDWECIWEKPVTLSLNGGETRDKKRIERLYIAR